MRTDESIDLHQRREKCQSISVPRYYAGRLIFDHLPKTAGQAVNAWLRSSLGEGCVTENLIGHHRELISTYGGAFSVISGHINFIAGEGLDPRYQYATMFRDPVDRVISWIYFVLKNHDYSQIPLLFREASRFLESEGEILGDELKGNISNLYVHHFSRILGTGEEDENVRIANSLVSIESYNAVGIYEEMPQFINDLGNLIGIRVPEQLEPVNVTAFRPKVQQISEKLRDRIVELNQLDLRLYATVRESLKRNRGGKAPDHSTWAPLPACEPATFKTSDITVHNVEMLTPDCIKEGDVMSFALDIELHRAFPKLEAGIHIFDAQQRWAFGINSTMLEKDYADLKPGRYRLVHHVVARLPLGRFTAGFAFADTAAEPTRDLFWHDALFSVTVESKARYPGIGYSVCPAQQALWPTS